MGEVERGHGVLSDGLLVLFVQVGVFVFDDLAHAELGQLLRDQLGVKQPPLDRALVLHEGGDDLGQVLLADTLRLLALGCDKALDFDLEAPLLLAEADIAARRVVAGLAVIEPGGWSAARVLWLKLEARRQHLLHQQACRDGLQRVVNGFGHRLVGGIGLGD